MSKKYYYIANWKMYWNFTQTVTFVTKNYDSLVELSQNQQATIILCPSTPALHSLAQIFATTDITIGGQDCSDHQNGAYTGQVSAEHLQTAGATYCIIGHSERRKYNAETDTKIASKCLALLNAGLTPILCIGETLEQNKQNTTLSVLEAQLEPIVNLLSNTNFSAPKTLLIAYEPVWAIGTGLIPTPERLQTVFCWLSDFVAKNLSDTSCSLIYGGSTASKNIQDLKTIDLIDGFLIGGASLDFEEFAKIIKSPRK